MSGAPFRELFVELTEAAFAIAKGIGEEAIRIAQLPVHPVFNRESRMLLALNAGPGERYMAKRYGFTEFAITRSAYSNRLSISGRLERCGHWHEVSVDERVLYLAPLGDKLNALIDAIDKRFDQTPRSCFCTPTS